MGFHALDYSTNGPGGGPIHTPSTVLKMYFQAGDNILSYEPDVDHTHATIGARAGFTWQLQAATTLNPSDWQAIGAPVTGDDYFHEVLGDALVESNRFYRVKGTLIAP